MRCEDIEWFENLLLRHRLGIGEVAMIRMMNELLAKKNRNMKNKIIR